MCITSRDVSKVPISDIRLSVTFRLNHRVAKIYPGAELSKCDLLWLRSDIEIQQRLHTSRQSKAILALQNAIPLIPKRALYLCAGT